MKPEVTSSKKFIDNLVEHVKDNATKNYTKKELVEIFGVAFRGLHDTLKEGIDNKVFDTNVKINVPFLGTFTFVPTAEREFVNPQKPGKKVKVAAHNRLKFHLANR